MDTISQLFATALAHHQAGRLDEAEPIYRQVLAAQPQHAQTWNLLGVLSFQRGQYQVAIDCLNRAIGLEANSPSFHIHLGHVYQGLNQPADAIACYRRAIELQPNNAEMHYNLANGLDQQQNSEEAIAHYRQALALRPGFVEAHFNLGNSLSRRHARDEAVACYRSRRASWHRIFGRPTTTWARCCESKESSTRPSPASSACWSSAGFGRGLQQPGKRL